MAKDTKQLITLPIDEITTNPYQPRHYFDEDALIDLKESIEKNGILSPIFVIKTTTGYTLVSGERRLRAARLAGLMEIPALIYDFDDEAMAEVALVENIQRENLSPLEEANAYQSMIDLYGYSQGELAEKIGKSRPYIANLIRLLKLPDEIKAYLLENKLSAGHARALLAVEDESLMLELAEHTLRQGISVRGLEKLIKDSQIDDLFMEKPQKTVKNSRKSDKNRYYAHIENQLEDYLQTKVAIQKGKKSNQLMISFYDEEDLTRLLEVIGLEAY